MVDMDNEFISFCLLCAQEQTIVPEDAKKQAPIEDIYINREDKIPRAADAGFAATSIKIKRKWYAQYLKLKFSYFMYLRSNANKKNEFLVSNETLWKEVFSLWKKQEYREAVVYLLRINQMDLVTVHSEFYNTFEEFNIWAKTVKNELDISIDFPDMGDHMTIFEKQNKINFEKVSKVMTLVMRSIELCTELTEKKIQKIFVQCIAKIFECDICDYLYVDDNSRIRLFVTSFEAAEDEDFEKYLEDSEYYHYGEGISGAIMLGNKSDNFFHTGTNNLDKDWRQSPWHTNAYSKFYREEYLHDFWVFPLYVDNVLVAAFRVINKKCEGNREKLFWSYSDRLQLLYLAKWFQEFQKLCVKNIQTELLAQSYKTVPKYPITEMILKDCKNNSEGWFRQDILDKIIEHLLTVVHRRIEKRQVGCCLIVGEIKEINLLCTTGGYYDYIIFNKSNSNIKECNKATSPLEKAAQNYNIIYPNLGVFVWDENLKLMGVKELEKIKVNESDNSLMNLTKKYPKIYAFLVERGHNSILIYHNNRFEYEYYLSDYDGGWHIRSKDEMLESIKKGLRIASMNDAKVKVYEEVFDMVWLLSYKKIGTMIVIAHPDKIDLLKAYSEQGMAIDDSFTKLKKNNTIYDIAMVDGAILMDEDNKVHYCGLQFQCDTILEPKLEKQLDNKGTRHNQAGHIACLENVDAMVFTVSENRGISVFYKKTALFIDT